MNPYEFGAGVTLALLLFGAVVYFEIRIRTLERALLLSKQKVVDDAIVEKVHSLSDAELHAEAAEFLGGDKPSS